MQAYTGEPEVSSTVYNACAVSIVSFRMHGEDSSGDPLRISLLYALTPGVSAGDFV